MRLCAPGNRLDLSYFITLVRNLSIMKWIPSIPDLTHITLHCNLTLLLSRVLSLPVLYQSVFVEPNSSYLRKGGFPLCGIILRHAPGSRGANGSSTPVSPLPELLGAAAIA